ncbi:MAG: arginine--tRNA ligase, partial [Erysipelotrichaceae bacterium]|nr:arginine--tRNA ligase [Erysipelotrichaceae bacterium]
MDFKSALADLLHGCVPELSAEEYQSFLEIPPNREMGDFAFPCFKLARVLRKAPPAIASGLKEQIEAGSVPGWISKIEVVGGYLNFFVNKVFFAKSVLDRILEEDKDYGRTDLGHGRTVCLDYSSINIAKPFHIGHLSSTVIGNSLYRIYNFLGYKSVGINHLGDWGTQFGKLIVAYRMWGDKEEIEREGVRALLKIYVKFHDEAEKNPELDEEARQWFVRIEQHDPYAMELFNWFREITLKEVQRIYELLDVHFDSYAGESFYNDKLGSVIDELQEKGLLLESQGAKVVDLSDFNMPPCMILKADGA